MTNKQNLTKHLPLALTALAALLLAGCGGGGSSSIDGTGSATTPSAQGTMSGNVVKGPVSGAAVQAFALSGGVMGAQLSSAVTDASGAFKMPMGSYSGPLMLQMSGGTYTDEATGIPMTMGAGDVMTAVLPTVAAGANVSGVAVTPLTAMAQAMAQHMSGGLTDANIAAANTAVGNYFMVHDILHTQPINPLVPGSAAGATQDMMNYGMTLAAMSQYAKGAGMSNSSGFVMAMMNDASDGVIDGKASGAQVSMGGGMAAGGTTTTGGGMMGAGITGSSMMQPDAGRAGLSTAMTDFMNSSLNRSGVSATSMTTLMQQLRDGTGQLH
ncbi:MAG: hypothetical protein ABI409_03920 [Ramlibacter sp.]